MHDYRWLVAAVAGNAASQHEPTELAAGTLEEAWREVGELFSVSPTQVAERVATAYGIGALAHPTPAGEALACVPPTWAIDHLVLPVEVDDDRIVAAVADPRDLDLEETLGFITGRTPVFVVTPPHKLRQELHGHYKPEEATDDVANCLESNARVQQLAENSYDVSSEDVEGGPVIKLANRILADAIRGRASDVHLGFREDQGVVRYRIDGIMRKVMEMPSAVMLRAVSRIKVIGGLDVADRLRPQDGRCRIKVDDKVYDLRISTVPTRSTEKAVLRILDPAAAPSLEGVSVQAPELEAFTKLLGHREGIVVVTGPTGSGKTTTLYAALRHLATEDVNVMTVEDPIEYELPGLTQIQVNRKQGVTFAGALRAVLRQDPDIILVGEIRDLETAEIAVQAGLTGHLVLATLHTNDAIASIRRLKDLGLDQPSIAESLRGVVGQRLVRRLCPECSTSEANEASSECDACSGTGFRGRAPVNEVVTITSKMKRLILEGAPAQDLYEEAAASGARSLRSAGEELVRAKVTSRGELERVLGEEGDWSAAGAAATTDEPDEAPEVVEQIRKIDGPAKPAAAPAADAQPATAEFVPERRQGPARILVVDDDNVARMMIRKTLEKQGYEVADAGEGLQAIQLLQTGAAFDLVITDLDMPEMSGRALLSQIRAADKEMSIIVLTGSSDPETESHLLTAGADDYLRKPVKPALFLARVAAALRRRVRSA